MALVSNQTKTIQVPNESHTAIIRKLSHKQLREAARARQSEGAGFMRELGGELIKALRDADTKAVENIQKTQQADITNYDRDTLLKEGIVSWTYEGKLPDATDFLDEPTASFFADEIFSYSRAENQVEAKNE